MEHVAMISAEAVVELQQMLDTPIEDQAGNVELALLSNVLQNGMESLADADSNEEAGEILRQLVKSAFVIGRRQYNQLT